MPISTQVPRNRPGQYPRHSRSESDETWISVSQDWGFARARIPRSMSIPQPLFCWIQSRSHSTSYLAGTHESNAQCIFIGTSRGTPDSKFNLESLHYEHVAHSSSYLWMLLLGPIITIITKTYRTYTRALLVGCSTEWPSNPALF